MITTRDGKSTAACTSCGDEEYSGTLSFREFVDRLKGQGWLIRKIRSAGEKDEWIHLCSYCRGEDQ